MPELLKCLQKHKSWLKSNFVLMFLQVPKDRPENVWKVYFLCDHDPSGWQYSRTTIFYKQPNVIFCYRLIFFFDWLWKLLFYIKTIVADTERKWEGIWDYGRLPTPVAPYSGLRLRDNNANHDKVFLLDHEEVFLIGLEDSNWRVVKVQGRVKIGKVYIW